MPLCQQLRGRRKHRKADAVQLKEGHEGDLVRQEYRRRMQREIAVLEVLFMHMYSTMNRYDIENIRNINIWMYVYMQYIYAENIRI